MSNNDSVAKLAANAHDDGEPFDVPDTLKARCQRLYGWTSEFADKGIQGYCLFMKFKLQQEDWNASILSPSLVVDQVWHQHILDALHYYQACTKYTDGHVIGHDPDGGLDQAARAKRVESTKICLKLVFRNNVDAEVWSFEEGSTENTFGCDDTGSNKSKKRQRTPTVDDLLSLFVKICNRGNKISIQLKPTSPMEDLAASIEEATSIPVCKQRLFYKHKQLLLSDTPIMLGMKDGDTVTMIIRLGGC